MLNIEKYIEMIKYNKGLLKGKDIYENTYKGKTRSVFADKLHKGEDKFQSFNKIEDLLGRSEKIMWEGSPQLLPYIFSSLPIFILGIFLGVRDYSYSLNTPLLFIIFPFCPLLYKLVTYKYTNYYVTNKKIIFKYGLMGKFYLEIRLDLITDLSIEVEIYNKIFRNNAGNINILSSNPKTKGISNIFPLYKFIELFSGLDSRPYLISNIDNPDRVVKLIGELIPKSENTIQK